MHRSVSLKRTASLIRGSWRSSTLKQYKPTNIDEGLWEFNIFDTYIEITNTKHLFVHINDKFLPTCPSINSVLSKKFPNFNFVSDSFGGASGKVMFFVWAHKNNPIPIQPEFIDNTTSEFRFRIAYMCMDSLKPGCLKFFIAPIYVIQQNGLYLKCLRDYTKTNMSRACSQEAFHLQTPEPQVFLTGQLILDDTKNNPYMITQKTDPFNKKYCMVHTAEDVICNINSVRVRKHYGRVSVRKCHCRESLSETVRVGMTFVEKTPLSFKYNPFLFSPWKWKSLTVPINYVGSGVTIPGQTEADITYNNCGGR